MAKLAGHYAVEDLIRALQGNFACQSVTRNSKGEELDEDKKHIRLELFFVRAEVYSDKVVLYKSENGDGGEKLTKLGEIQLHTDSK